MQIKSATGGFLKGNDISRPADAWEKDPERRNSKPQTPEVQRILAYSKWTRERTWQSREGCNGHWCLPGIRGTGGSLEINSSGYCVAKVIAVRVGTGRGFRKLLRSTAEDREMVWGGSNGERKVQFSSIPTCGLCSQRKFDSSFCQAVTTVWMFDDSL